VLALAMENIRSSVLFSSSTWRLAISFLSSSRFFSASSSAFNLSASPFLNAAVVLSMISF
jgi:hypothetical protein